MTTGPRIDPKTRRLIVSDLTPSIRSVLEVSNNYDDIILFTLSLILENLEKANNTLDNIETHLSSGSGEELNKEED